ncbi:MAG: VOC family protein [Ilumatobacter sp.]|uniref:VOC family protein n=1 Tax=Ilumatobacter sp. TaxID=1967498 RepID=UPI0026138E5E|nr:VOC family protein [Ilumatobacter sp.]MDJ0767164.1 VOC family protein [Ilumatobacter sp.]
MAGVATYLHLPGTTEEAFEFYKSVFGTEYNGDGIMRFADAPAAEGVPDEMGQMVMHVGLTILGDHLLMGSDSPEAQVGNHVSVMLMPDTKAEADELFAKLSDGGSDIQPPQDMFWGDYWGQCTDKFGVIWQIDVDGSQST